MRLLLTRLKCNSFYCVYGRTKMGSSHSNIEEVRLNEDTLEDEVTMAFMKSDIDIAIIKEPDRDLRKVLIHILNEFTFQLNIIYN